MSQNFYTDIDLNNNQLLELVLENIDSTTITSAPSGRFFWCTVNNRVGYWNGTQVIFLKNLNDVVNAGDIVTDALHNFVTNTNINNWNSNIIAVENRGVEYVRRITNVDATSNVQIAEFPKATSRAIKVDLTIEDVDGKGTLMNTIHVLFDGNYPTVVEYGQINSVLLNTFTFYADHDANNVYLYVISSSNNCNMFIKTEVFEKLISIQPILVPEDDLMLADGLLLRQV